MVTENADLQQQLQSSEREREAVRQQLTRKEAELMRAEETNRREQQQIQQLRQQVCMCMYMYMYVNTLLHVYICGYSSGKCVCLHTAFFTTSGGYQS